MDHFEGNENEVSTGVILWLVGYVLDNYYRNHFERLRNYGRRFSQFGWYRLCFILSQIGTYVANRVTNKIEQIDDNLHVSVWLCSRYAENWRDHPTKLGHF